MKTKNIIIYTLVFLSLILSYMFWNKLFEEEKNVEMAVANPNIVYKEVYFAWGCFWCMEWIFEAQKWVKEAIVWYAWWDENTANYEDVSNWDTKHKEAVKIVYDPKTISYDTLVSLFWTQIDPTNPKWQFADIWPQYETAIYYQNDEEKSIAEKSKNKLEESKKFNKKIATLILPLTTFFKAEEYHQDYYKKSALKYSLYKKWSWREWFIKDQNWDLEEINKNNEKSIQKNINYKDYDENLLKSHTWRILLFFHADWCSTCKSLEKQIYENKMPDDLLILKVDFDTRKDLTGKYTILSQSSFVQIDSEWNAYKRILWISDLNKVFEKLLSKKETLKEKLSPLEFSVTQMWWTEKPFDNAYWDNHTDWIYVDIVDSTPLFSSTDKFDSWTWWPSFSKPIDDNLIQEKEDNKFLSQRTELTSKNSESHLWHIFNDWPEELWWMRYCINSAALKFIPLSDMEKNWYWKYLFLFEK